MSREAPPRQREATPRRRPLWKPPERLRPVRRAQPDAPRLGRNGVLWLVAYAFGLGVSHNLVIAPAFAYLGFEKVGPNPFVGILMLPTYVLCARRLPASWERPSTIVYWMLFVVVVAPIHVLPVFTTELSGPIWLMVGSVAAAFWLLGGIYSMPLPTIPRLALPPRLYWPLYALLWLVLVATVVSYYGFQLRWVSLSEIYEIRGNYRESFEQVPRMARYAITWLGNVVAPIAIARGLTTRRWLWAVLGVTTELFLVSITGFKQMLFSSILVAGVVILVKTTQISRLGYRVAALAGTGVFAVTAFDFSTGGWSLSSVFVRRMVLTTAVNTKYHYEYFTDNPKAHLGYGLLSRWVDYPYDLSPAFLIGKVYYGNPETSANANVWADAFANFGIPGVLAFTAILGAVLLFVDAISRGLPEGLAVAAFAQSAFSLSNTAMLTVFLTHGMLLAVALVFFMPAEQRAARPPPLRPRTLPRERPAAGDRAGKRHRTQRRRQRARQHGRPGRRRHPGRRYGYERSRRQPAEPRERSTPMTDARTPRVLVLNHFALPRSEGGGTRHVELFSRLSAWSHLIVAGNRNNNTQARFASDSPDFVTVPVPSYASNGLGRVLNWLVYAAGALVVGLRQRGVTVVYASSPHLLTPLAGWALAKVHRAPLVLEVRDLWPRSMVELGYLAEGSRLHRVLVRLERFLYRRADRIVAVATGWEDHFASFGVPAGTVEVVTNGAEPADLAPSVSRDKARAQLGVDGFVAVYAGAHGPANGLDQILDVAARLTDTTFVLVGDGLDKARLVARARADGLDNVRFLDPVPKRDLGNVFVGCDVGLHTLAQADLFKEAMSPNKLYDYMAAGLPVITNVGGGLERRLVDAGCAVPGSAPDGETGSAALGDAIQGLRDRSADERETMGHRARDYVERHASRTVMAARLEKVLDEIAGSAGR